MKNVIIIGGPVVREHSNTNAVCGYKTVRGATQSSKAVHLPILKVR